MSLFRLTYSAVILFLLVTLAYTGGYNTGWDSGYIVGAVDVTLGGVQLETLCDRHGNCKVPEQYSN